jgi:hypothetical protein
MTSTTNQLPFPAINNLYLSNNNLTSVYNMMMMNQDTHAECGKSHVYNVDENGFKTLEVNVVDDVRRAEDGEEGEGDLEESGDLQYATEEPQHVVSTVRYSVNNEDEEGNFF